jgi:arsenate reductase (thioredoxin)
VSTGAEPRGELSPTARLHIEKAVEGLVEEFGHHQSRETIERLMDDSVHQLVKDAQVEDFLPALAHRFTRERLKAITRAQGPAGEEPDVLFIGLGDTGRGQMAAALLTLRSEGRIVAHSAGSHAGAKLDPAVMEVMAELGTDLSEAYAKPLTPEVLGAADVVVTMGRSVGAIEIPEGTRHVDWRVGDPTGASVDEARRVRDEIDARVTELLGELGAEPESSSPRD